MSGTAPSMGQQQQAGRSLWKQQSHVSLNIQGQGVPDGFDVAFQQTANAASGALPVQQLQELLELVQLPASHDQVHAAVQHLGATRQELSRDDA